MQEAKEISEHKSQRRLEIDQNVQSRIDYLDLLDAKEQKGLINRAEKNKVVARSFEALHQRYLRAKKDSNIDRLTQLFNRNYFDTQAGLLLTPGKKIGALILDVDHFKKINDNYGHPIGDRVLSLLGNIITSGVRQTRSNENENDIIARYGGEEIIILFPEMRDIDALIKIAEKIRTSVEETEFKFDDKSIPVTISIGAGLYKGESKNEFLKKIDAALYEAKNQGRNKTIIT